MSTYAERLIAAYQERFQTQRGQKIMFTPAGRTHVNTPAERVLILPNGVKCRVAVDDSGVATQVEEDEALHAIVRPHSIRVPRPALGGPRAVTS